MSRNFHELLESRWNERKLLCVGLDSDIEKIPEEVRKESARETVVAFNRAIVDATRDLVCAYKPNSAFYEVNGDDGAAALRETIAYIIETAPEVPIILDAKRGDIASSNDYYARTVFDSYRADSVTVSPFLGGESLQPFFDRKEKGVIVLCHTSNPGATEIQELKVGDETLYQHIARRAVESWNGNGNCCLMVGATYPEQLKEVREIVGDMPILTAGIGAQNGDLEKTVMAGKDGRGRGLIVNASRSVIFASRGKDFADAARKKAMELHSQMGKML